MLSLAARIVADRLSAALMALARATAHIAAANGTPDLSAGAAHTLFFRVSQLILRLMSISDFGIPTKAERTPDSLATTDEPDEPSLPLTGPASRLPRHRGWLLAAIPDIAPTLAAELRDILADPATASLLEAAPAIARDLRLLLNGLAVDEPLPLRLTPATVQPPSPTPDPPPPSPQPAPIAPPHQPG